MNLTRRQVMAMVRGRDEYDNAVEKKSKEPSTETIGRRNYSVSPSPKVHGKTGITDVLSLFNMPGIKVTDRAKQMIRDNVKKQLEKKKE